MNTPSQSPSAADKTRVEPSLDDLLASAQGEPGTVQTKTAGEQGLPPLPPRIAPWSGEAPAGVDVLGLDPALVGLAELVAHRETRGPLSIGLVGGSGSGKSFALNRLLSMIGDLRDAAATAPNTPFATRLTIARLDAAQADGDTTNALAAAIYDALRTEGGAGADRADEVVASSFDPRAAARAASERMMDLRRKLDAQRQELHDLSGRRARLAETVLYQTSGSRIDAYARSHRGGIESRLRSFGFDGADQLATYKDLVRDVAERPGIVGRVSTFVHAMWAFRGQTKLLVWAAIFFVLAWALGHAESNVPGWVAWLRGMGDNWQNAATFVQNNAGWIGTLRSLSNWLVLALLALNIARAFRFVAPLYRGVAHLAADMEARRLDLDHLIANQTRLVDDLSADTDAAARRADEAERRVVAQGVRAGVAQPAVSPFARQGSAADADARAFLAALAQTGDASDGSKAAQRIVVAVDNLDALLPGRALATLEEAMRALTQPLYATIVAVDPTTLGADGNARLAKLVQTPLNVGKAPSRGYGGFVKALLGQSVGEATPAKPNAATASIDMPMRPGEAALLETLSTLAGGTPRQVLRFVNLYRLARVRTAFFAPLALALAIETGGDASARGALLAATQGRADDQEIALDGALATPLKAVAMVARQPVTVGQMREALAVAGAYSL